MPYCIEYTAPNGKHAPLKTLNGLARLIANEEVRCLWVDAAYQLTVLFQDGGKATASGFTQGTELIDWLQRHPSWGYTWIAFPQWSGRVRNIPPSFLPDMSYVLDADGLRLEVTQYSPSAGGIKTAHYCFYAQETLLTAGSVGLVPVESKAERFFEMLAILDRLHTEYRRFGPMPTFTKLLEDLKAAFRRP